MPSSPQKSRRAAARTRRFEIAGQEPPKPDDVGSVQVTVLLRDGVTYKRGNLQCSLTVRNARVGEVFNAIRDALVGGRATHEK